MRLVFIFLIIFFQSCQSTKNLKDFKGSYLDSIRLNYDAGVMSLANKEYDKAISYFQFIKSKYPFSQYAALSDLRIADAKFQEEKYIESASLYEVFLRLHPRHEQSEYAFFQVALSFFNAIPSHFFLFPDPASLDQSQTEEALKAFDRFLLQYPVSAYAKQALEKKNHLFETLARHNSLIADYYLRRGRYLKAVNRFLRVFDLYPQTKESENSLFLAAQVWESKINNLEMAVELYNKIINNYPQSSFASEAKTSLKRIKKHRKSNL